MIIQFLLRSQKHPSYVMVRLMEATMLIQKQNAKHSIFVPMMEMEDLQNTVSCVLMEPSSNSSTLCVTGGLMWTVLLLSNSILLMMKLLLKGLQILLLVLVVITKVGLLEEDQVLEVAAEAVEGEGELVVHKELLLLQEDLILLQMEVLQVDLTMEVLELIQDMGLQTLVHIQTEEMPEILICPTSMKK